MELGSLATEFSTIVAPAVETTLSGDVPLWRQGPAGVGDASSAD